MSVLKYIPSLFSLKKITEHKHIAFTALWDTRTKFTKYTHILGGAKMSEVTAGRYTRIGDGVKVTNAELGNFAVLSKDTVIGTGAHPTNYITPHSIFYKKGAWPWHDDWIAPIEFNKKRRITIGNDVWIGRRCMVLDGVTIGDGAIIAAGAVVTKDIPPYAIAGGVPAKVIKYRFPQEVIDRLLEIRWWDLSDEEIKGVLDFFHTPNPTMEDLNRFFPKK